jgi:hypothetical protein
MTTFAHNVRVIAVGGACLIAPFLRAETKASAHTSQPVQLFGAFLLDQLAVQ